MALVVGACTPRVTRETPEAAPTTTSESRELGAAGSASKSSPKSDAGAVLARPNASAAAQGTAAPAPAPPCDPKIDCLARAREAERAGKWTEALTLLEQLEPGADTRLLAERGYVALRAGSLARARQDNLQAFGAAEDDAELQGQILFNQGRVEEAQGKVVIAAAYYAASLALRQNQTVADRLARVGTVEDQCHEPASVEQYCDCARTELAATGSITLPITHLSEPDAQSVEPGWRVEGRGCEVFATEAFDGRVRVVSYGHWLGLTPYVVVAVQKEEGQEHVELLRDLGDGFEPGAFGVHNTVEVSAVTMKTVAGRPYALIEWAKHDYDQNMAGLEVFTLDTKFHTLCVEVGAELECPFQIPIEQTSASEHHTELLDGHEDPERRAALEELKKTDHRTTSRLDYRIDGKGFVRIGTPTGGTIDGYEIPKSGPLFR